MGPLLFNLYRNYLEDIDPADLIYTCQYTDDTTQYQHLKISQIRQTIQNTQKRLDNLNVWSRNNNLLLNGAKTKYIIFSTTTKIKQNVFLDFEYSFDQRQSGKGWQLQSSWYDLSGKSFLGKTY